MSNIAIFLDRDDTIIKDPGYINDPEQVRLIDGVGDCLAELKNLGYKLVLITNQSAVARGMITEGQLGKIHHRLKKDLADFGVSLDAVYYCPFHPEGVVEQYKRESHLRKPNPGMLLKAADEMDIDLENSWMVGNSQRDVTAGVEAGCKTILIRPQSSVAEIKYVRENADYVAANFKEATNIIKRYLREYKRKEDIGIETATETVEAVPQNTENAFENKPEQVKVEVETEQIDIAIPPVEKEDNGIIEKPDQKEAETISTNQLLTEISHSLKSIHRQKMFNEFSAFKLVGMVLQFGVVMLLVLAIFLLLKDGLKTGSTYVCLAFATVIQLMAIAFFLMNDRR